MEALATQSATNTDTQLIELSYKTPTISPLVRLAELQRLAGCLGFVRTVRLFLAAPAHVLISVVSKAGLIRKKIAATFSSTDSPPYFIHPVKISPSDICCECGSCTEAYGTPASFP